MKNKLILSMLLIAAMFASVSCEKAGGDTKGLSVEITDPQVSGSTAIFTIIPSLNTVSYEYTVTKEGASEAVKSEQFTDGGPREITLSDLEMASKYIISVKVSDGSKSVTEQKEFTTAETSGRRNLFTKFTGTWCANCPNMTKQLDRLVQEMGDKVVIIAMHGGDDLSLQNEMNILQPEFGITGYPTGLIDYYVTVTGTFSQMKAAITKSDKNFPCVTDIELSASISGDDIKISSVLSADEDGKYKYCVVVTEDNISRPGTVGSDDGMYHHVARAYATNALGDMINGDSADMKAGESKTIESTIAIDPSWNRDNLNAVVYMLKQDLDGKYYVNNVNTVKISK